jgi:D-amino-acid dehydrogenase
MQVAVIGGGVIGVCTAYFLAVAGHEVVVIERYGNVAQEASFGNTGILSPGYAVPWAAPGMPKKILSYLLKSEAPVLLKATVDPALWRWMRMWLAECEIERHRINAARMQRMVLYSRDILHSLQQDHALEYEQTTGFLQLFRSNRELEMARPAIELLAEYGIGHRLVDADAARQIEPALAVHTPLAAGLYFPQDESGNCPLFTRQLKNIAESIGVEFHFNSAVSAIDSAGDRITMHIEERSFSADAVVIAAGSDSMQLLEPLGIRMPLYPVKGFSATALIKNLDEAPLAALMDESYKVAISRMGNRIRIAGTAEIGSRTLDFRDAALRTLIKVGNDWFPDAANYNTASFWCGAPLMLPDGLPLLGTTSARNVFINTGHGLTGWAMAAGSGKVLADIISGKTPDIDIDGLTLSRYE